MAAIKLDKFIGTAPKVSSELLPNGAGQIAYNLQLYSGDLIPYSEPAVVDSVPRLGTLQTLFAQRDPVAGTLDWMTWLTDVDIVTLSETTDDEQRFYYTGDGAPKVSTYALATNGAEPYPVSSGYYDLGLPLPTAQPAASAASFTSPTSTHYARDSGNTATITTSAAHGFRDGQIVTVRGFTGAVPETFNVTNVFVTVLTTTTFSYFSAGATVGTTADTNGVIDLAGDTITRQYTYTWYTPWIEESIGADPSDVIYMKEGQSVTVSSLPTSAPSGDNFISGMQLYRTLSSPIGTEFYRLHTLWFPVTTSLVAITSNVATVTVPGHHNFIIGDRFKLSGCTDGTFDITGGIVTGIPTDTSFTYALVNADIAEKADTGGSLFHDVAEFITDTARYWADASYDFTDDFDFLNLVDLLVTDEYDAPNTAMTGLVLAQNNMVVGFFDNQLCFAEPGKPWAWPTTYRRTFEYDIVAIIASKGHLLVLTTEYAYRVAGNDPATLSIARLDTPYPCLSKRSVVNMGYGVLYATYGGLALWSPKGGLDLATKYIHDWDTWDDDIDPSTIVGHFFDNKYFGAYDGGSFLFERDEKIGGYYVDAGHQFNSAWTDSSDNALYTASDDLGNITQWGSSVWPLRPMEWKSKTVLTKDYINIGAARVIADYDLTDEDTTAYTTFNDTVASYNTAVWSVAQQLNPINGPTDYLVSSVPHHNFGELNRTVVHGDPETRTARTVPSQYTVIFQLWQNKTLVFTQSITSDAIFRCPAGYKSDTFEVSVASSARVRSIHLGETPSGLRKV